MSLKDRLASVKEENISHIETLLRPLGFVNQDNFMFYHPDYDVTIDYSATHKDKILEVAVKKIYMTGLDYGVKSTQRVMRNALGMDV